MQILPTLGAFQVSICRSLDFLVITTAFGFATSAQKWVEEAETNDVEIRGMVMNDHMRLVQTSESRFQQADETLLCRLAWTRYRKTGLQGLCKWQLSRWISATIRCIHNHYIFGISQLPASHVGHLLPNKTKQLFYSLLTRQQHLLHKVYLYLKIPNRVSLPLGTSGW